MKKEPALKISPEAETALAAVMQRAIWLALKHGGHGRTCLGCIHFDEHFNNGQGFCDHWKASPPARVIVESCEAFDCIPF